MTSWSAPSPEDLRDIQNLDTLSKAWHVRKELCFLREDAMEREAISHGIGEPAHLGRVDRGVPFLGVCPA